MCDLSYEYKCVYIYLDTQFQVIVVNDYPKVSVWDKTTREDSL